MKGKGWACAQCHAFNAAMWSYCEACGAERGRGTDAAGGPTKAPRTRCDCGAGLTAKGVCERMGGYPATSRCPFACPVCSGPLDWSGGCDQCHGCTSGRREEWRFPGDRYELEKGHWQRVDGPRKACSRAENAAGMAQVRALLGMDPTRPSGAHRGTPSRVGIPAIDPAIRREVEGRG